MISGTVSFLFGILLLQQFSFLPDILWCWGLVLVFLLPFLPRHFHFIILFILGFLWAVLRAHWILDPALPTELQGKDVLVTGVVASIPLNDQRKRRFEFDIETLEFNKQKFVSPGRVRLSWYNSRKLSGKNIKLKAGQRWQFWLRLKQPHGFMNPGGFDYEAWLYQKHIRATGYVRVNAKKDQFAKKIDDEANGYQLQSLRQSLFDKLLNITSDSHYGGILIALAMGERTGITQEQWRVFRATGTSHLVAISGLHVGLLAGFVFLIIRRLWPYCGSAALRLASPRAAAIGALFIATFYAALSGFAVPAQRALIMLFVALLAVFRMKKVQSSQVLSLALFTILLLDPAAVLAAGFWLSFAAVSIISFAAFGRLNTDKSWKIWGRLQWRISLVLIPLLVFLFQQASLMSPLANLFAIPIVSLAVVPVVLLASTFTNISSDIATHLFSFSDLILNTLWWILAPVADMPISEIHLGKPNLLSLILATAGIVLLLTPRGWPAKYLGLFMLIPMFWPNSNALKNGEVEITLLDVGQGLAAVIQSKNHALLFDTGPRFSEFFDTGSAVILPFIRQKGIKKLDMIIVSHKDNDHRGGLKSILSEVKTAQLLSSYKEKGSSACFSGQNWSWDGVLFEILNPNQSISHKKRNNASCVLRVSTLSNSLLLSADIEKRAEKHLVQEYAQKLESRYLVVPHHGSKTSSSQPFLDAVKPEYALIPVGFRNRYRMPHSTVLERYNAMGIKVLKTSKSGAITVRFDEKNTSHEPLEYRKKVQKYWNSRH